MKEENFGYDVAGSPNKQLGYICACHHAREEEERKKRRGRTEVRQRRKLRQNSVWVNQ